MARIGRRGGRARGFNLEYARRLARLELLEQAEKVLYDAVFDERVPWRDRVRAAFAILDAAPPRDPPDWLVEDGSVPPAATARLRSCALGSE